VGKAEEEEECGRAALPRSVVELGVVYVVVVTG